MNASNVIYVSDINDNFYLPDNVTLNSRKSDTFIDNIKKTNKLPFEKANVYYNDDLWDFTNLLKVNLSKSLFKFNFNLLKGSVFTDDAKNFVLLSLLDNKCKIQTIYKSFLVIKDFLLYIEHECHIYHIEDISTITVKHYINKPEIKSNIIKSRAVKRTLKSFFSLYSANFKDISSKGLMDLFELGDSKAYRAYKFENRTKDIPRDYFNKLVAACITIMNDKDEPFYIRGTACMYILLSQTGLRIGELLGLTTNSLKTKSIFDGRTAYYLEYKTWKREHGNSVATFAITYINELSYEAYNNLLYLYKERREEYNLDYLYMGGLRVSEKTFPMNPTSFKNPATRLFVELDNKDLLKTVNLPDDEFSTFTPFKAYYVKNRIKNNIKEDIHTVTFPTTQQFRFHCCSILAEKGVPLEYIKRCMSHLTSDMVSYHILPQSSPQEDMEASLKVLREVVSGKTKILGGDKGMTEKINQFIEDNHFNVATDLEEICEKLAQNIPIRLKTGGVCIKSSQLRECSKDATTNEMFCAYNVCPNLVHFYYYADITYRQCKELEEVIAINEKRGHKKEVQKQTNMLYTITTKRLIPELEDLERVLERDGYDAVYQIHPEVASICKDLPNIKKEAATWIALKS